MQIHPETGNSIHLLHQFLSDHELQNERSLIAYLSEAYFSFVQLSGNEIYCARTYELNERLPNDKLIQQIRDVLTEINKPGTLNHFLFSTPRITLVPNDIWDESQKDQYFGISFSREHDEILKVDEVTNLNAKAIWAINQKTFHRLAETFHETKMLNASNGALNPGISLPAFMLVEVEKEFTRLSVFKDEQLVFFNSFLYSGPTDLLYYITSVSEITGCKLDADKYLLAGFTGTNEPIYTLLKKYIANLNFISHDPFPTIQSSENNFPYHLYFSLLRRFICAS